MRTNAPIDSSHSFDFSVPKIEVDTREEEELISISRSDEWHRIVEMLQERKEFWKHYLPGGVDMSNVAKEELVVAWKTAHNVIKEIDTFINIVESNSASK